MKILVVEDDRELAAYVKKGLHESGLVVDVADCGDDGLHLARDGAYDLIVLDVVLPDRDGWSVISELRRAGKKTPVLFLSARDGVPDRVKGLELGADDYLVKPFAFSELLARVRSILRRGPVRTAEVMKIADLEIDLVRHRAVRGGKRLDLTPKEFALLAFLARRPGEPRSRTVIAEQVWDMNFDSDTNVIDVHVRRLRAKVDDPFAVKLIRTVRGIGYVLDAAGDGGEDEPEDPPPPLASLGKRMKASLESRLDTVEEAAAAARKGQMRAEQRLAAEREAHRLAGSLGTLGFPDESRVAREMERVMEEEGWSPGTAGRVLEMVALVRTGLLRV